MPTVVVNDTVIDCRPLNVKWNAYNTEFVVVLFLGPPDRDVSDRSWLLLCFALSSLTVSRIKLFSDLFCTMPGL